MKVIKSYLAECGVIPQVIRTVKQCTVKLPTQCIVSGCVCVCVCVWLGGRLCVNGVHASVFMRVCFGFATDSTCRRFVSKDQKHLWVSVDLMILCYT